MDWRTLALKNSFGNSRRYIGYLLSGSLAVMVFFMFSMFLSNPAVQQGHIAQFAKELFSLCQYVVALFTIFFIFFFHAGLIRMRNREFGLFLVLGLTPRQVGRLLLLESLLLGLVAMGVGMGMGLLFYKLFLLAMTAILDLPVRIPFLIPRFSVWFTLVFFGVLFWVEAFVVSYRVRRLSPQALLVGTRVHQKQPRASLWWTLLGLLCLVVDGTFTVTQSAKFGTHPFLLFTLAAVGTYLLFSQAAVFFLRLLRKKSLSGRALLVVSRLSYRIKDQARMLTVVTLLTTLVMTGMASVFGFKQVTTINEERVMPFALELAIPSSGSDAKSALTPEKLRNLLRTQQVQVQQEVESSILVGTATSLGTKKPGVPVKVLSASDFETLRQAVIAAHPDIREYLPAETTQLAEGQARFYAPYPLEVGTMFPQQQAEFLAGDVKVPLHVVSQSNTRVLNKQMSVLPDFAFVVSDATFAKLQAQTATDASWTLHGFVVPNWKQTLPLVQQLHQQYADGPNGVLTDTATADSESNQLAGVMLFAGFFVSLLFLLAAGSTLYLRLFAQQEEDRKQFLSLQRIGLQQKEAGHVLTIEFLLMFFVPFAVAALHSLFAMIDVTHLMTAAGSFWPAFLEVCGLCLLLFSVYFLISRLRYLRQVSVK